MITNASPDQVEAIDASSTAKVAKFRELEECMLVFIKDQNLQLLLEEQQFKNRS